MHRPAAAVAAALVLLLGGAASAQTLPAPFEARYEGSRFPLTARATLALARAGEYYKYTLRGGVWFGFFRATEIYDCSVLRLEGGVLRPLEYVHRDSRKPRRNLHTRFDWDEGIARTEMGDGAVRTLALGPAAWDVMSIQVRLRLDVQDAAPGESRDYAVVYRGELRRHRAQFEGRETIETAAGELAAVRVRDIGPRRASHFWFAPDHAYLPARLTVDDVTLELASPPGAAARAPGAPSGEPPAC